MSLDSKRLDLIELLLEAADFYLIVLRTGPMGQLSPFLEELRSNLVLLVALVISELDDGSLKPTAQEPSDDALEALARDAAEAIQVGDTGIAVAGLRRGERIRKALDDLSEGCLTSGIADDIRTIILQGSRHFRKLISAQTTH